jgi:hypothetical protein
VLSNVSSYTGNLPTAGQEGWFSVTFTGNGSSSFHPHITMTAGASEFGFDVATNCSGGTTTCGMEGGVSTGRTDWETFWNQTGYNNPIPLPGTGGTVFVRVFRKAGGVTCNNYTLTITD